MHRRIVLLVAVLALCDCGGGDPAAPDAGGALDASGGLAIAPPDIPWLAAGAPPIAPPMLVCPTAWREVHPIATDATVTACEPWPETGRATCVGPDQAHFPGEPGCVRVGTACPAGDFAEDLPTDRPIRYVNSAALAGGDGTAARPFRSITEARTGAGVGTVIALARGRYDSVVTLGAGMTLWGACVAETRVTTTAALERGVLVTTTGTTAGLRNLMIDAPARMAIVVSGAGHALELDSVVIDGAYSIAIIARMGASIRARSLVVRNTRPSSTGQFGRAIDVEGGASVDLERVVVDHSFAAGVLVVDAGSSVRMTDALVADTGPEVSSHSLGFGVDVQGGGSFEGTRVVLEQNHMSGVLATDIESLVSLTDAVVRGTLANETLHASGVGLMALDGGTIELVRGWIAANQTAGVTAQGGTFHVTDTVVSDGVPDVDGRGGGGGYASAGGSIALERVVLANNIYAGVMASGELTSLALRDVRVIDTLARASDSAGGFGIVARPGATLDLARVTVERSHTAGVLLTAARALIADLLVRDTRTGSAGAGRGIEVDDASTADLSRVVVDHCREAGMVVGFGSPVVTAQDLVVRDVESTEGFGRLGRGITAEVGGSIEGHRVLVERAREEGVLSRGVGSTIRLTDLEVRDVLQQGCVTSGCPEYGGGTAIGSVIGASLTVSGARLANAVLCGAFVADGASLDLDNADVSGMLIGACVQVDGYDVARLSRGVRYHDNGTPLQATTLPVPEAIGSGVGGP